MTLALAGVLASTAFSALPAVAQGQKSGPDRPDGTTATGFYIPEKSHYHEAHRQIADLRASGDRATADRLGAMVSTPQAVWVTGSDPKAVTQQVRNTTHRAAGKGQVPVLAAYNLPFRDCSQYSAGGATDVAGYKAWIDALAAGIQDRAAMVILEPDGLGIIPWYRGLDGALEWCQPAEADAASAAAERFEMLNYAVDRLKALPDTKVYLDGTHSAWLGTGEISSRLVKAGVQKADGFFLNVSNYELTERQLKFGSWVSQCIHYATEIDPGAYGSCASQYYPASPADFSTWGLTDAWYAQHVAGAPNAPSSDELAHFVIDTSRNGRGPWVPSGAYPDPQVWCNPPGRGLGYLPTSDTGNELADAFLWIKVPGESDGECSRGLTDNGGVDPEWGRVDPAAGAWFPEQALDLIANASARVRP
ncbi:glycoside hydrolase family 6 protein [Arthrobacter sp. MDT1-48-3]